jgi:hypothetical protein
LNELERRARDEWLKQLCVCGHTLGWHFPIIASNVPLSMVQHREADGCRHNPCQCTKFKKAGS